MAKVKKHSQRDSSAKMYGTMIDASQVAPVVRKSPASAGDTRDTSLIPGLGRSPGEGDSNPLWYSCLEDPIDRGAWWAAVHGVTKSRTQLSCTHTQLMQ